MVRRWLSFAFLILCVCGFADAQSADSAQSDVVLHSNPRLVIVDVVVTDTKGQPVTGLTARDFTLFEDGKPQGIKSVEAHTGSSQAMATSPTKAAQLGPHEYTNAPGAIPSVINIVLLDMLNTSVMDQSEARRKMLAFLKRLPPGQPLALFTLGSSRLRMIQGVTGNSEALTATVEKMLGTKSIAVKTDEDRDDEYGFLNEVKALNPNPEVARSMAEFLEETEARHTDTRVAATREAMQQIARAVAAYPGRKNLMWLSGGFPISFTPGDQFLGSFGESTGDIRRYQGQLRETAALLSSAQVAIYPIDVRGLIEFGTPGKLTTEVNKLADPGIHDTMNALAEQTGGKAFYNRNDLDTALADSIALGSTYYTLSYTPPNGKWDGSFRHISVKLARKGFTLSYRRGYFAIPDNAKRDDKLLAKEIESAMLPISIDSTALILRATVVPPGSDGKVQVHYILGPGQIPTRDAENRPRDLHIDFVVTAWNDKDQNTGTLAQTVNVPAQSEALNNIERFGLAKSETLTVKPGTSLLRVGVVDRNTGKIGTLEVPLTKLPPLN